MASGILEVLLFVGRTGRAGRHDSHSRDHRSPEPPRTMAPVIDDACGGSCGGSAVVEDAAAATRPRSHPGSPGGAAISGAPTAGPAGKGCSAATSAAAGPAARGRSPRDRTSAARGSKAAPRCAGSKRAPQSASRFRFPGAGNPSGRGRCGATRPRHLDHAAGSHARRFSGHDDGTLGTRRATNEGRA